MTFVKITGYNIHKTNRNMAEEIEAQSVVFHALFPNQGEELAPKTIK
ncbi:MAG: hypothetical protein ACFE7S_00030 [Candidatus Hodarchaeota archaeon]